VVVRMGTGYDPDHMRSRISSLGLAVCLLTLAVVGAFAGTALASSNYNIKVHLSSSIAPGGMITPKVTGFAAKKSFVDFALNEQPCSKAISSNQGFALGTLSVRGSFRKTFSPPLGIPEGPHYLCVYLVPPRSEKTLASASARYTVE
jgi:hypothetical protein